MAKIEAPEWLDQVQGAWLPCKIIGDPEPSGTAVEIRLNGDSVGVVVPHSTVTKSPDGKEAAVRVQVLAELPSSDPLAPGRLVELPAQPLNASQRVRVKAQWLDDQPPAWLLQT